MFHIHSVFTSTVQNTYRKDELVHRHFMEAVEWTKSTDALALNSSLVIREWSDSRSRRFNPGQTLLCSLNRKLCVFLNRSGLEEILIRAGNRTMVNWSTLNGLRNLVQNQNGENSHPVCRQLSSLLFYRAVSEVGTNISGYRYFHLITEGLSETSAVTYQALMSLIFNWHLVFF